MKIEQLHHELKKRGVSSEKYYLHGLYGAKNDEDKLSLQIKKGKYNSEYEVYFKEHGQKTFINTFYDETDATEFILDKFVEQKLIEKSFGKDFSGMTVNERLYVTDLVDEFENAKKLNRNRAERILRYLKVDTESIELILK